MATDLQKILVIHKKLLDFIEDNYKVFDVCDCLVDVLSEISSSNEMVQLVSNINTRSDNLAESFKVV